jgi:putative heme-binding domain-containing protein
LLKSEDPALRLGALIALRRGNPTDPAPLLRPLLGDADATVRQMALIWAGEAMLKPLLPDLDRAVTGDDIPPRLFETWLATLQILQGDGTPDRDRKGDMDPAIIERIAHEESRPPQLRALALPRLKSPGKPANRELLTRLAQDAADASLRIEAIRSLATLASPETAPMLTALALDTAQSAVVRCEALLALSSQPAAAPALLALLDDPDPGVALQTARMLRFAAGADAVREALQRRLKVAGVRDARVHEEIEFALGKSAAAPHPATLEEWQHQFAAGGDPASGERVFFSPIAGCVQCHRIHQRGGIIGPDLSVVARTADRDQLIHSIVKPSDDIAPQFQGWVVATNDGRSIMGLQGHMRGSAVTIITLDGKTMTIPGSNIASFQAMPASLMPEGLPFTMSPGDFRDLIAFLESLR